MNVTVLCPNARHCCVKVTPSKLLREVLEEACLKSGFDMDGHHLVNQGRSLDLSLPFRLSGLPNNATLEMVPVAKTDATAMAMIALQYIGSIELQKTTLLSIGISSGKCLIRYHRMALTKQKIDEINARVAREEAEKQALLKNYAQKKAENEGRKEVEEARLARFEEETRLMRKRKQMEDHGSADNIAGAGVQNLKSFDVSVSSAPSILPFDRHTSINSLSQEMDIDHNYQQGIEHHDRTVSIPSNEGQIHLSQPDVSNTVIDENATTVVSPLALALPCDRRAVIFLRQTSEGPTSRMEEVSDEFFEVDVEDIRTQLKQLRQEVHTAANRALVSREYVKQKNREGKLLAYRHTVVRIPVGTGRMVQSQFRSAEPISNLFGWVRNILSCSTAFSLKLALNHKLEDSDSLNFVDADVAPKSTVFIKFNDPSFDFESLCIGSLQECTQDEADNLCYEWLSQNTTFKPYTGVIDDGDLVISRTTSTMSAKLLDESTPTLRFPKTTAIPKWLKKK